MHDSTSQSRKLGRGAALAALFAIALAGLAGADSPSTLAESLRDREAGNTPVREVTSTELTAKPASEQLAETWGIEVASIRLTAHNHMIDYRYRVLDADKAATLFQRQIKPQLIHQETGRVLAVPDTAKVGPLRNSNTPQNGRIYWMFFGNAGDLVKAGDAVTVVIGDSIIGDLIVE